MTELLTNKYALSIKTNMLLERKEGFLAGMKIIVVNFYGTKKDVPGATKHYEMAKYFQSNSSCNVQLWINGVNYYTDQEYEEVRQKKSDFVFREENGLNVIFFKGLRHKNNKILRELGMFIFSFKTAVRLLREKNVDIIVLSLPPVNCLLALIAQLKKIPVVADVEDLWPLFIEQSGVRNRFILKYYEVQANYIYKHSVGIEAVSEGMLNYVKNKIRCGKKMCWVAPLGVNLHEYNSLKYYDAISKYSWKDDFKIMYIGAHGLANDIGSVLKTIRKINEIILSVNNKKISYIFIGDGSEKKNLEKEKDRLKLRNVYFEDAISSEKVPAYILSADICITNLRRLDCFKLVRPNKLFQYMAARKPVICGIWGETSEIITNAGAGICVDFTKHEAAASQIKNFILSDHLSLIGQKGYDYVAQNGDRDKIFEEYYKRLKHIVFQTKGSYIGVKS